MDFFVNVVVVVSDHGLPLFGWACRKIKTGRPYKFPTRLFWGSSWEKNVGCLWWRLPSYFQSTNLTSESLVHKASFRILLPSTNLYVDTVARLFREGIIFNIM